MSSKLSLGLRDEVVADKVEVMFLRSRRPFISRLDNPESNHLFHLAVSIFHDSLFTREERSVGFPALLSVPAVLPTRGSVSAANNDDGTKKETGLCPAV